MTDRPMTPPVATVFVVDDDAGFRKAIGRLIKATGYAVETFASAREFLDLVRHQDIAGCVVLDVRMPGLSGLDLQQELKAFTPPLPIIFLTGYGNLPMGVRAMKDGATDFLTKPVQNRDLLRNVEQALARNAEDWARHRELQKLLQLAATLTPREREVMALVVRGWLNKQTARELGTVEKTIKVHRARVMEKMKVTSLADLIVVATKLGIQTGQATASPFRAPTTVPRPSMAN